jgi:hypothetical protein
MQWLFLNALWLLATIVVTIIVIIGIVRIIFINLKLEKLTLYIDFAKWIIVSVALVIIANVVDVSFKDRAAGINEIQQYDKYVSLVTEENKLADKRRLAQYFAIVTPSEKLRDRWKEYFDTLNTEYENKLIQITRLNDSLTKLLNDIGDKKKPRIIQKIIIIQQRLEDLNYEITPSNTSTNKNNRVNMNDNSEAVRYEKIGFEALFQRNVDNAIEAFKKSEVRHNGFHMVNDIWNYLITHKQVLGDSNNNIAWRQAYKDILKKFARGMSDDIKEKMEDSSK